MRKSYKTEAVVIKAIDLAEGDRIVRFLSPGEGKFDAVCRGARKLTSSTMGKFEPFNLLNIMVAVGKSLDVVTQAGMISGFPNIRGSLDKMAAALYLLDLIDKFVDKGEENPGLFRLLKFSIRSLEKETDFRVIPRVFEIKMTDLLGYMPNFDQCVLCGAPGEHSYINYHLGGLVCPKCRPGLPSEQGMGIMPGTLQSLRFLRDTPPTGAVRLKVDGKIESEMKRFLSKYMTYNMPGGEVNGRFYEQITR